MTLSSQPLPTIGQPNSTEDSKVRSVLSELQGIVNGNLDTSNIAASAGITDAQLASPNNATIQSLGRWAGQAAAGSTYTVGGQDWLIAQSGQILATVTYPESPILWSSAYAVPGKTATLMYSVSATVGTPKPTLDMQVGLKQVTINGAGTNPVWGTSGSFVGASYVASDPAAGTTGTQNVVALGAPLTAGNFYAPVVRFSGGGGTFAPGIHVIYELFVKYV